MKNKNTLFLNILCLCVVVIFACGLAACQAKDELPPVGGEAIPAETGQETPDELSAESSSAAQEATQGEESASPQNSTTQEISEPDSAAIETAWKSSEHARAFVVDATGQNNTCAQCHAPINWQPTMDTLPDSCFVCKFELEDPPPYIPEDAWVHIPCQVCHRLDKNDNVQPEIAWLDIAPLEEYIDVASPTELCLKCHAPIAVPLHGKIDLTNAHADYVCTGCHNAHTATATCVSEACHSDVIKPATPIPGHDIDHQSVTCVACHDGGGLQVGPDEESGLWTTYYTDSPDGDPFTFPSHNIVLESRCDRCHYVDNPWGLTIEIEEP